MTGAFIGRRRDRLGARLLVLLNCMRLSGDYGAPFLLDWFPPGADAPELARPEELFRPDWIARHMVHARADPATETPEAMLWEFQSDRDATRLRATLAAGRNVVVDEGFLIAVLPWEDEAEVRARHAGLIGHVGFSETVAACMARIDAETAGRRFTAYHLRRGDIIDRAPWTHKTWPAKIEIDELYKVHLQKSEGEIGIVFTDTQASLDALRAHVPEARGIGSVIDLSGLTPAQRDLLELYAMSRADQIVAPSISAFSSAAAQIAGKDRRMFREVLTEAEIAWAYDQLAERMARLPDAFPSPSDAAHHYGRLHSHLTAAGRIREAWALGKGLERLGCGRAFLPILLALNEFYLQQWAECEVAARAGLQSPDLWPEDHAVLTAVLAAAVSAQGRRAEASDLFARAFWAKPARPDVVVIGSRLLYRGVLDRAAFPPIDWDLLSRVRRPWFPPFINLSLVQHRFIRRRPVNFDLLLLDWGDLALDRRARRLSLDRTRLKALRKGLMAAGPEGTPCPSADSALALIEMRLGAPADACLSRSEAALAADPANPVLLKRHADLLAEGGDPAAAHAIYRGMVTGAGSNGFVRFAFGLALIRDGAEEEGEDLVLDAARAAPASAAIQGEAGQILLRRGQRDAALAHLHAAQALCPRFGRFGNQIARIEGRVQDAIELEDLE